MLVTLERKIVVVHYGKRRNSGYQHYLIFPLTTVFKSYLSQGHYKLGLYGNGLTLSWKTNFRLKVSVDDNFEFNEKLQKAFQKGRKRWRKEKLFVESSISFSHSVFKSFVLKTRKNKGLFYTLRWSYMPKCCLSIHDLTVLSPPKSSCFFMQLVLGKLHQVCWCLHNMYYSVFSKWLVPPSLWWHNSSSWVS